MHDYQYKIACLVTKPGNKSFDVLVYARTATPGHEPSKWKLVVRKSVWVDDLVGNHGRMLKTLLRGLA